MGAAKLTRGKSLGKERLTGRGRIAVNIAKLPELVRKP
jgi:hypothetical protein